jgi:hypothetical protein
LGSEVLLALLGYVQYLSLGKTNTVGIALIVGLAGCASTGYTVHRLTALLSTRSIGGTVGELRSFAAFARP